jgi:hypothetical protein
MGKNLGHRHGTHQELVAIVLLVIPSVQPGAIAGTAGQRIGDHITLSCQVLDSVVAL